MELKDEVIEKRMLEAAGGNSKIFEKDSIQFNCQDLDQEQKVDVNPKQVNSQNIHIYVGPHRLDYSGRITGVTYMDKNKTKASEVKIYLYFGCDKHTPVYETSSDSNGNFSIENLPPGYYTLVAKSGTLEYKSPYIKVLPCHEINENISLKG